MKTHYPVMIIGDSGHGKSTLCRHLETFGLLSTSSSREACVLFICDELAPRFGYKSWADCYNDRHNHRLLWKEMISSYNKDDPARLARAIYETNHIYDGCRSIEEFRAIVSEFNPLVIWVRMVGGGEIPHDVSNDLLEEDADLTFINPKNDHANFLRRANRLGSFLAEVCK